MCLFHSCTRRRIPLLHGPPIRVTLLHALDTEKLPFMSWVFEKKIYIWTWVLRAHWNVSLTLFSCFQAGDSCQALVKSASLRKWPHGITCKGHWGWHNVFLSVKKIHAPPNQCRLVGEHGLVCHDSTKATCNHIRRVEWTKYKLNWFSGRCDNEPETAIAVIFN